MPVGIYNCKLDNAENSFPCIIAKKMMLSFLQLPLLSPKT